MAAIKSNMSKGDKLDVSRLCWQKRQFFFEARSDERP
jgi:hypothetical protein